MIEENIDFGRGKLWVCSICGMAYCCIPNPLSSMHLWCDNNCSREGTEDCLKIKGYTGNPTDPYKKKFEPGKEPFELVIGKCPDHFE